MEDGGVETTVKESWQHKMGQMPDFPPLLAFSVFKLADRMRSMRTNGASKNRDYCDPKWLHFPHGQL